MDRFVKYCDVIALLVVKLNVYRRNAAIEAKWNLKHFKFDKYESLDDAFAQVIDNFWYADCLKTYKWIYLARCLLHCLLYIKDNDEKNGTDSECTFRFLVNETVIPIDYIFAIFKKLNCVFNWMYMKYAKYILVRV